MFLLFFNISFTTHAHRQTDTHAHIDRHARIQTPLNLRDETRERPRSVIDAAAAQRNGNSVHLSSSFFYSSSCSFSYCGSYSCSSAGTQWCRSPSNGKKVTAHSLVPTCSRSLSRALFLSALLLSLSLSLDSQHKFRAHDVILFTVVVTAHVIVVFVLAQHDSVCVPLCVCVCICID